MPKEIKDTAHEEEEEILETDIEENEEEDVNEASDSPKDEIGKLLEIIGEKPPETEEEESSEEEEESSEEEEETKETKDEEEEESEEEGEPDEESKDELEEEEESEEEEPPEEESSDELVNRLREEINTLSKQIVRPVTAIETKPTVEEGVEEEQPPVVISTDITQEEYDEAMTDKDKFSKLIDKVVVARTKQELSNVAQSVDGAIAEKLSINQRVNDFFDEHENLRGVRDYIGTLADRLSEEHKDWNMDKIFKELPDIAYKNLGLSADSTTTNRDNGSKSKSRKKIKSKSQRPAFTKGSKTRASADNLSQEQKDISQTLEL